MLYLGFPAKFHIFSNNVTQLFKTMSYTMFLCDNTALKSRGEQEKPDERKTQSIIQVCTDLAKQIELGRKHFSESFDFRENQNFFIFALIIAIIREKKMFLPTLHVT